MSIGHPFAERGRVELALTSNGNLHSERDEAARTLGKLRAEMHSLTPVGDEPRTGRRAEVADLIDSWLRVRDSLEVALWFKAGAEIRWTDNGADVYPERPARIAFDTFTGRTR